MLRTARARLRVVAVTLLATLVPLSAIATAPSAGATETVKVLINLDSVFSSSSIEKAQAEALGYTVTQVTGTQWRAMTQADFAQYRALIVGDRCSAVPASVTDTSNTWAPVVMGTAVNTSPGNRIVIGTDPPTHGKTQIVKSGIRFAATQPGRTGIYYDDGGCSASAASLLTLKKLSVGTGSFTTGSPPCGGSVAFIANHPSFSDLHTTDLAGWGCSVHITYPTFPDDFSPLALATDTTTKPICGTNIDSGATACGQAYILISGSGLVVTAPNLSVTPTTASKPAGTPHTVTASLSLSGAPLTGTLVKFTVSGQNAGATGSCLPADCKSATDGTVAFTFTGAEMGDDTVTASFTDASGAKQQATAAVNWLTGNTPPAVTVGGVSDGATYEIGAVPAPACDVSDAQDGVFVGGTSVLSAITGPHAAFGVGSQTVTCSYTDHGGLSGSGAASYTIADTVRPVLTGAATSSPNGAGWYRGPVAIHWSAGDTGTGIDLATAPSDSVIDSEGAALVASATVSDNVGNSTTASSAAIKVDRTDPSTGIDAPVDWRNASVDVTLLPSDNLSGVASTTYRVDGSDDRAGTAFTVDGEGQHVVEFFSKDKAGNVEATRVVRILIDLTPPTITHTVSPAANAAGWHRTSVVVTFVCGDGLSGIRSCTAPTMVSANGTHLVPGVAVDRADNRSTDEALVKLDADEPTISGSVPAANAAGWFNTHVTVAWDCADTGGSGVTACAAAATVGDGTGVTVHGAVADLADNTGSGSVSGINVDTVRPSIVGTVTTAPNGNGWYNGDVVVHWTCEDDRSGVVACPVDSVIDGEGANLSASAVITDVAGNPAVGIIGGIHIDRTAPTTSASTGSAVFNALDWSAENVTVTLASDDRGAAPVVAAGFRMAAVSVADETSGVAVIKVSVDGSPFSTYTGPIVLSDGVHTVKYFAVDAADNAEATLSLGVKVDTTVPTITATRTAANARGWNNTPVVVTFHCGDLTSGVASCPSPVTLPSSAADQRVVGQVMDNAGNGATVAVENIDIDLALPVVTYTGATSYTVDQAVTIACAASDALSGVLSTTCADVRGPASTFTVGTNTRTASATDNAGNVGNGSVTFRVSVTFDSLCALSNQYTDGSLGNSLCAKLAAAEASAAKGKTKDNNLDAYRKEVSAQSGKKISAANAATLIRLSNLL